MIEAVLIVIGGFTCAILGIMFLKALGSWFLDFIDNVTATNRARRELYHVANQRDDLIKENLKLKAALAKMEDSK